MNIETWELHEKGIVKWRQRDREIAIERYIEREGERERLARTIWWKYRKINISRERQWNRQGQSKGEKQTRETLLHKTHVHHEMRSYHMHKQAKTMKNNILKYQCLSYNIQNMPDNHNSVSVWPMNSRFWWMDNWCTRSSTVCFIISSKLIIALRSDDKLNWWLMSENTFGISMN